MPKRSTGCERCRRRKVKCDEGRPHCNRCSNYGASCPGYRPSPSKGHQSVDQAKQAINRPSNEFFTTYSMTDGSSLTVNHLPVSAVPTATRKRRRTTHYIGSLADGSTTGAVVDTVLFQTTPTSTLKFPYHRDPPDVSSLPALSDLAVNTLCADEISAVQAKQTGCVNALLPIEQVVLTLATEAFSPIASRESKEKMLAAIEILALSEFVDGVERSHRTTRDQTNIPRRDKSAHTSTWYALNRIRQSAAAIGLVRRRALPFAEQAWRAVTAAAAKQDPYVDVVDILVQLPGLLQRVDALTRAKHDANAELVAICNDVCWLRKELDNWIYWRHAAAGEQKYTEVDVCQMETFSSACCDCLFQTVYWFESVELCSQYQLYWTGCLALDQALHSLCWRFDKTSTLPFVQLTDFTDRTEDDIQNSCFTSATNFCKSIPYSCEHNTSAFWPGERVILEVVRKFFEEGQHRAESAWCLAVQEMQDSPYFAAPWTNALSSVLHQSARHQIDDTQMPADIFQMAATNSPQPASCVQQTYTAEPYLSPAFTSFSYTPEVDPTPSIFNAMDLSSPRHDTAFDGPTQKLQMYAPSANLETGNVPYAPRLHPPFGLFQVSAPHQQPGTWDMTEMRDFSAIACIAPGSAWVQTAQPAFEGHLTGTGPQAWTIIDGLGYDQHMNMVGMEMSQMNPQQWGS